MRVRLQGRVRHVSYRCEKTDPSLQDECVQSLISRMQLLVIRLGSSS